MEIALIIAGLSILIAFGYSVFEINNHPTTNK